MNSRTLPVHDLLYPIGISGTEFQYTPAPFTGDTPAESRPESGLSRLIAPRLSRCTSRLARIAEGEHSWAGRPVMDSYHTVWFELHEDLIGRCGPIRADEAAAGRAH
ncbi:hypothetical protein [Nocardia sp. NPDC052566]|uniref:hypothetical protein n=1 Tax=Nocardia sp. NPDC052566 TaxID=3364330 RepID=UPI0037C89527